MMAPYRRTENNQPVCSHNRLAAVAAMADLLLAYRVRSAVLRPMSASAAPVVRAAMAASSPSIITV
jgi:hypothetical protein